MVALPSFSLGESLLSHYGDRIPALEHRYLLALLVLNRIACDLVLVVSPGAQPPRCSTTTSPSSPRSGARRPAARLHVLEVPDPSHRSIAEKLLDRPDLVERAATPDRRTTGVHRAVERHRPRGGGGPGAGRADQRVGAAAVAARLQERRSPPVQGGRGAGGRRAARTCARSTTSSPPSRPCGRRGRTSPGVVIKHDDSGAGDGNQVIDLRTPGRPARPARGAARVVPRRPGRRRGRRGAHHRHPVHHPERADRRAARPPGRRPRHPRAGDGRRRRPGVHGLPLPGRPGLRGGAGPPRSGRWASAWPRTACSGAPASTSRRRGTRAGDWHLHALEVNLRKGGTTHPYAVLRNMAPGHYDEAAGRWITRRRHHPRLLGHRQPRGPGVEGRAASPRDRPGRRGRPPARPGHAAPASCCTCCRAWPSTAASASRPSGDPPDHAAELYEAAGTAIADAARGLTGLSAPSAGFEPATHGLGNRRSIP